jgi:hypothetical protein
MVARFFRSSKREEHQNQPAALREFGAAVAIIGLKKAGETPALL